MKITIRGVEEADFPQLLALFKEFAVFEKLPDKMLNALERMIQEKDFFHCYVAVTDDNQIVGYVSYFFCYYTWVGKSLYMDDLYVSPAYRNKGIGKRLLAGVTALARKSGCHKLRWQVSRWNAPAITFYKSIGASIDDVEQNCDLFLD